MPKSQQPDISPPSAKSTHSIKIPKTGSITDPGQPYNVPKIGSTPSINHSKQDAPPTDNMVGPKKSRVIFDT